MCDAAGKKRAVFTNPLKKTQVEHYEVSFLRLDRMLGLGPQQPVAIAATKTLRPLDSRGANGRFYMRNFYILIYLLVTNIRLKACFYFNVGAF